MPTNTVTVNEEWTCADAPLTFFDDNGSQWILTNLGGWFGGLDVRDGPIDRPLQDGSYDGPSQFASRVVTLEGTVVALDTGSLQVAMEQVASLLAGPVRVGPLVVDEEVLSRSRQAQVRLGGPTLIQKISPVAAEFSLSLYCADPYRYSTDLHEATTTRFAAGAGRTYNLVPDRHYGASGVSGVVSCPNAGTTTSWPTFTFSGPLVNPAARLVGGPGIEVRLTLVDGQTLVVDMAARTVLLDGASRRSSVTFESEFFGLLPGDNQIYFTAQSGTGALTVAWRDAWA